MTKKYTHFTDEGHGWLSVSQEEILELGLENEISEYSYMNGKRVYLEEDRDATIFLKALESKNKKYVVKENEVSSFNRGFRSFVRSLSRYRKECVGFALDKGTKVIINSNKKECKVVINKNKLIIEDSNGLKYKVPKSNPYSYITPIKS